MLKVLFLASASKPDYMCDMVYHGLKSSPGIDVEEIRTPHYMYNYFAAKDKLYGMGFTLYARLPQQPNEISIWQMLSRIRKKYYDFIIYGSVARYNRFFEFASWYYDRSRLISIDGEDDTKILKKYVQVSKYFKRELDQMDADLFPINFSVPEELILAQVPTKTKRLGHIIPGDLKTYIYKEEAAYFKDYQDSIFGATMKKAGWDCLRHYEILMNGCIPYFKDLDLCPERTMVEFPKKEILQLNSLFDSEKEFDPKPHIENLLEHTRNHLTTRQLVRRFLNL